MRVERLNLTHYRGARDLHLDFDARLNVFCGVNGAGKSTVLDAIAILLSWAVSRIRHAGSSGRPIAEEHITNACPSAAIELQCQADGGTGVAWRLSKARSGHGAAEDRSSLSELNEFARDLQRRLSLADEQCNLPLFVYYPVNRAVLDIPLRIRERHRFTLMSAYDDALTSGANFRTFFEWFREREDLENEYRRYQDGPDKPEGYQFPDRQLEAVRSALGQFMPDFSNLTVRRNPLRMEVQKGGERLSVNQLSDGEKCVIALIGDLARRLAIANPVSEQPLSGAGVVLIDEIDLHLHPGWQRIVVPRLLEVFPGCQFFISTHSPHVITQVQPPSLFFLAQTRDGMVVTQPNESYGKTAERILEDLMGLPTTRPDPVAAQLGTVFDAIEAGQLAQARSAISGLRQAIGDDPELVKAEVLIRRHELIGR